MLYAIVTGEWRLKQMYEWFYFPIAGTFWLLGALGLLPRVKASTKGEGHERRYFYGSVWAVTIAQPICGSCGRPCRAARPTTFVKLVVFIGILAFVGNWRASGCCRGPARSFPASSPFPTDADSC